MIVSGVFLIIAGLWLLLQTVIGQLPQRLLSFTVGGGS